MVRCYRDYFPVSLINHQLSMEGKSSLWCISVYVCAVVIDEIYIDLKYMYTATKTVHHMEQERDTEAIL